MPFEMEDLLKERRRPDSDESESDNEVPQHCEPLSNYITLNRVIHAKRKSRQKRVQLGLASFTCTNTNRHKLHQSWYSIQELKELEQDGMVIKRGPFSTSEDKILTVTVLRFNHGGNVKCIEDKAKLWDVVCEPFPTRTLQAIYHRIRRIFDPMNTNDRWSNVDLAQLEYLTETC